MKCLCDILNSICMIRISNAEYYKMNDLLDVLKKMNGEPIEAKDTILTPFYICDSGVLEIYDYELNIRLVDHPGEENFILAKTGKTNIDDVDTEIYQKIKNCYLEVVNPRDSLGLNALEKYIEFVMASPEIKNRINGCLHEFDEDKLFFEIF